MDTEETEKVLQKSRKLMVEFALHGQKFDDDSLVTLLASLEISSRLGAAHFAKGEFMYLCEDAYDRGLMLHPEFKKCSQEQMTEMKKKLDEKLKDYHK